MAKIVAGRFETQSAADRAFAALKQAGFAPDDYGSFFLNPAGQHAKYPIGGDAHHDEGTRAAPTSALHHAVLGTAGGLAAGVAIGTVIGGPVFIAAGALAGAGAGAYVGSLAGALRGTRSGRAEQASIREPVERAAGIMVTVCADRADSEERAIQILRDSGALEVERATGVWHAGEWEDFDPRRAPRLVDAPRSVGPRGPAGPRPA